MNKFVKETRGFTLIELIVVIALMALLAVVGLTNYQASLQNGRDSRRKLDLKSVASALQAYYSDNLHYPLFTGYIWLSNSAVTSVLTPNYLKVMPSDPKFIDQNNGYKYKSYGGSNLDQCYCLTAQMERATNARNETNPTETFCTSPSIPFGVPYYLIGCP